jgi:hypothetical protein
VLVFLKLALAWTQHALYIRDTRLHVHSCCSVSARPCCCKCSSPPVTVLCSTLEVLTALLLTVQSFCSVTLCLWVRRITVPSASEVILVCLTVEGTAISRNVGNLSPNGTTSHATRSKSSPLVPSYCIDSLQLQYSVVRQQY